ncbi:MAG: hypothetical protein CTY16_08135 [Methylobacter sp.]|nr:MAG: hypothetical protein CTY16_08135 [Methylobacter sp.]
MSLEIHIQINKLKVCLTLLIASAIFSSDGFAKTNQFVPPKVSFEVATRQLIDNVDINKGVHIFRLDCAMDWCELTQISLECEPFGISEKGFTPRITNSPTWSGFLKISAMSEGMLEVTVFQGTHHQLPAKIRFNYIPELNQYETATRVTAFKVDGLINLKLFPNQIKTVDYVPITGSPHSQPLGCDVMVPGIVNPLTNN